MKVSPTGIAGVLALEPQVFADERGFFFESWNAGAFGASGISVAFVQDNHSRSRQGTLRGLHYQLRQPQGKLVRVVAGEVFDVVVDLRRSSPSFGRWIGEHLSAENHRQLWIPPGCAHGFYVLSPWADVAYKASAYYAPGDEHSLRWDDPALGISWPLVNGAPLLSAKDAAGRVLTEAQVYP